MFEYLLNFNIMKIKTLCTLALLTALGNGALAQQFQVSNGQVAENSLSTNNLTDENTREVIALPYSEGFESGTLNQWTVVNGNYESDPTLPTGVCTQAKRSGSYGFRFNNNDNVSDDVNRSPQYLISPEFDGSNALAFSFYYRNQPVYKYKVDRNRNFIESFQVGYSMTTNHVDDFYWGDEINCTSFAWQLFDDNFPIGTKYIAVKCTSVNQNHFYLDDFSFLEFDGCVKPSAPMVFGLTNSSVALDWTGNSSSYVLKYGTYNTYTFEDGWEDGWTTIDADGDHNCWLWSANESEYPGHNSVNMVYSQSYDWSAGGLTPDNYLISPQVPLGGSISFYARAVEYAYSDEHFGVAVSTTNNTIDTVFTTIDEWTASYGWVKYTVDLSAYLGQTGYIAIRHFDCSDMMSLAVDDITIVYPATMTIEGITEESYVLEGLDLGTNYYIQVRGVCGETLTDWSATSTLTMTEPQTFNMGISGYGESTGGWHLIAPPVRIAQPSNVTNMIAANEDDYDLYYFDQSQEDEWRNYKQGEFNLRSGKGYLYANKYDVDLSFTGTPVEGDTYDVTLIKDNTAGFCGWNLVGNPFAEDIAYIGRPFYKMNDEGSEIIAAGPGGIAPMEGVFVIANENYETLTFTKEEGCKGSLLALNLSQGHGVVDRAIIRFGEGRQLPKFQINSNSTKVYIPMDGEDYAVVYGSSQDEMPVNFKAQRDGTYVLSIKAEDIEFDYLHLVDNLTGADVNLLQTPNYIFEAKTTDCADRFKLIFVSSGNDTEIGHVSAFSKDGSFVVNNEGEAAQEVIDINGRNDKEDVFVFFSDGSFFVNNEGEATLQVIDVNGRIVRNETIIGCTNVDLNATSGVYVMRLINGDNVKTQKIVVK